MKNIVIATCLMLSMVLGSGCKKDSPDLPMSELIMGQWKWISFGLKVVSPNGETTNVISQSFPPAAFIKFDAPNIFVDSEDGINTEQTIWILDSSNNKVTIADTDYNILRLDTEYLILGHDVVDPATQVNSRYSLIFKR